MGTTNTPSTQTDQAKRSIKPIAYMYHIRSQPLSLKFEPHATPSQNGSCSICLSCLQGDNPDSGDTYLGDCVLCNLHETHRIAAGFKG